MPVITLDGKGNRDVIENGKNGFIIKNQNPFEFVDKFELLIDNPEIYIEISEYAKKFAQKYDIKTKTNELAGFYKSILRI